MQRDDMLNCKRQAFWASKNCEFDVCCTVLLPRLCLEVLRNRFLRLKLSKALTGAATADVMLLRIYSQDFRRRVRFPRNCYGLHETTCGHEKTSGAAPPKESQRSQ